MVLKPGREKPVQQGHPWIFSGSIHDVNGDPGPGDTVEVLDHKGNFLARGAFSPSSQIRVRIWTWNVNERIEEGFFQNRISQALEYRKLIGYQYPTRRLIHAESDGLPGLIADQYGNYLVVQVLSAGAESWKDVIIQALADQTGTEGIYERSDVEVRNLEGLEGRVGKVFGHIPPGLLEIDDYGVTNWVDLRAGHKTGAYLDQRFNRELVGTLCQDRSVLDCFCYTGGFSLQALKGGAASVTLVDESADALALAEKHIQGNQFGGRDVVYERGDVFEVLRGCRDRAMSFDVIILDPPKFAPTAALAQRAARGYKDINLLAMKLLNPGGLLATFSCSGGISRDFFLRILSGAALDAEVNARIQLHMGQSADHSINLRFPEGIYLKGFGIRVDS